MRTGTLLAGIALLCSGMAGLGYQLVWTRVLSVGLGSEAPGMLASIMAFFVGLSIGSLLLDKLVSSSRTPGRWYAGLELFIGAYGVFTVWLLPRVNEWMPSITGPTPSPALHWAVAFGVPLVTLLPATLAMGATLPAMDRFVSRLRHEGRTLGLVYALNTLGAVAGTLLSAYVLMRALGLSGTILALASLNVVAALLILLGPGQREAARETINSPMDGTPGRPQLAFMLFGTGLLGIGYEVLAIRVMARALESTVYSFAGGLSVYLLFTAIGGTIYQRFLSRVQTFGGPLPWLLIGVSVSCLLSACALAGANGIYNDTRSALGGTMGASIFAELLLALIVFAVPSMMMGVLFMHLAQAARRERAGVGWAFGVNTLGGALAAPLLGVGMMPLTGAAAALAFVGAAYLLLIPKWSPRIIAMLVPSAGLAALLFTLDLRLVEAPEGGRVRTVVESVHGAVAVVEQPDPRGGDPLPLIKVNNQFNMGGLAGAFAERRQAHIPLLLHGEPRRALFLGLGTGTTWAASRHYRALQSVGVELVPDVVRLMSRFDDAHEALPMAPRLRAVSADARRYVRAADDRYDVIVADLFHPGRDGAGNLYTREHFEAVRARLAPNGLFCQWLPTYQMDGEVLRTVVRTYLEVFPHTEAFICHFNAATPMLGLVGSQTELAWAPGWTSVPMRDPSLREALEVSAITGDLDLFGCYLADRAQLEAWAGEGPINTDDRPVVIFDAPRSVYLGEVNTWVNILDLFDNTEPSVEGVWPGATGTPAGNALERFWKGRDLSIRAGARRLQGDDQGYIDGMLASIASGPEFTPAYGVLLQNAQALNAAGNRDRAIILVRAMEEARPDRPEARMIRMRLEQAR
ncbi:MAG: fused MFS/spermidine synthase [Planctomycetota bacterium]